MPSRQPVFNEPAKILEPISGRAEQQGAPRDPGSLLQDSHPLEIIDLQRFCFNLKGRHTVHPSPLRQGPIPIYLSHPQSQTHTPTKALSGGQTHFGNEAPLLQPLIMGNKLTQKDNADSEVQFITPVGPRQSLLLAKDPDQHL